MKKFKKVYIEITNVCNLSCAFCPGTARKQAFMKAGDFEKILKKLSGFTEYLYFHVMGEPLLHPELAYFLELCENYGFRVNITTNGTLISKKANILLESSALRQVNFSLHSQEEITEEVKLDNYLEDIFEFTDKALEKGSIYISYRLWNISSDKSESYNAYIIRELEERFETDFTVKEALNDNKRVKICDRLFLNSADVFEWPSLNKEESDGSAFCLGLRDQLAVLNDGTVVPCCLDSDGIIKLGNIFNEDLQHILNGERAQSIYEGFSGRRAVEELCRKCAYRTRF